MGVTVSRYTPLTVSAATDYTLGYSPRAGKLMLYDNSTPGRFRLFNEFPPYEESSTIATTVGSPFASGHRAGAITGYIYHLRGGPGTGDEYQKIDPVNSSIVATLPANENSTAFLLNRIISVTDVSESSVGGDTVALVHSTFGTTALLAVAGSTMTISAVSAGADSNLGQAGLVCVSTSLAGHRWLAFNGIGQARPYNIPLWTWNGSVISVSTAFTISAATDVALFGEAMQGGVDSFPAFWDSVNERLILSGNNAAGTSTIVIALEDDWSTVAWRTTLSGGHGRTSCVGSHYHQMTSHCAYVTTAGSGNLNAYLLRLSDGVVVDSGLVDTVDTLGTGDVQFIFREAENSLYIDTDDQDSPLLHVAFDELAYPDTPTYPDSVGNPAIPEHNVNPGFAAILRQGPVNRVINTNIPRIADALSKLVDKDSDPEQNPTFTLDLNGHQLVNLLDTTSTNAPARMP